METVENTPITPESVLSVIREMALSFDKRMKESDEKFDREMVESRAEFKKEMTESRAEFDRRMKNLDEMIGGVSNSNGIKT